MTGTTTQTMTFGDSLRRLADIVDQVPSIVMSATYPEQPFGLAVGVKTPTAVEGLARVLGTPVRAGSLGVHVHTSTDVEVGRVVLHVYNITPTDAVLRRPASVTEQHMEWEQ